MKTDMNRVNTKIDVKWPEIPVWEGELLANPISRRGLAEVCHVPRRKRTLLRRIVSHRTKLPVNGSGFERTLTLPIRRKKPARAASTFFLLLSLLTLTHPALAATAE